MTSRTIAPACAESRFYTFIDLMFTDLRVHGQIIVRINNYTIKNTNSIEMHIVIMQKITYDVQRKMSY